MPAGGSRDAEKMTDLPRLERGACAMRSSEQEGLETNSEGKPCRLFFEHSTACLLAFSEKCLYERTTRVVHVIVARPVSESRRPFQRTWR